MNISELKEGEKSIELERKKKLTRLYIEYAKSNQEFEIGQIIDNGVSRILIDDIKYSGWSFNSPPCCVYYGVECTRKNEPYKNGKRAGIRQDSNKICVVN